MATDFPLILIVDDDEDVRLILKTVLKRDYRFAEARDGQEGFVKAVELHPDVIITDVRMPNVTGDMMVHRIRADPALQGIPVIVASGYVSEEAKHQLESDGVTCFLGKPVDFPELRRSVQEQLQGGAAS